MSHLANAIAFFRLGYLSVGKLLGTGRIIYKTFLQKDILIQDLSNYFYIFIHSSI